MDSEIDNALREVSLDAFIQQCNATLINYDPAFADSKGIKVGDDAKGPPKIQSPEELAAEEAAREKAMQESMQADIVNSVTRRIEGNMAKYDDQLKD